MNYEQIRNRLAPSGLLCKKCFTFKSSNIAENNQELKSSLGNFDIYAERFVEILNKPVFKNYPGFKELLGYFSVAECSSCRNEKCKLFKDCKVRPCSERKGIDFFQCPDFPCNDTGFEKHLAER